MRDELRRRGLFAGAGALKGVDEMRRWDGKADCAVAGLAVVVAPAVFGTAAALCSIAGGVFGVRFRRGLIFCLCAVLPSAPAPAQDGTALRTTVFQGAEITYEVIDGLAIYEGDIILGTAAEVAAWNADWSPAARGRSLFATWAWSGSLAVSD